MEEEGSHRGRSTRTSLLPRCWSCSKETEILEIQVDLIYEAWCIKKLGLKIVHYENVPDLRRWTFGGVVRRTTTGPRLRSIGSSGRQRSRPAGGRNSYRTLSERPRGRQASLRWVSSEDQRGEGDCKEVALQDEAAGRSVSALHWPLPIPGARILRGVSSRTENKVLQTPGRHKQRRFRDRRYNEAAAKEQRMKGVTTELNIKMQKCYIIKN